jgi:arylsulfatase A-like enzyme
LAQTIDIAATILARAGVVPANGMQGHSLLGITGGTADRVRLDVLIEEEGQRRDFGLTHRLRIRSLITARHRLTLYAGEDWGELYDLIEDPLEQKNLWRAPDAASLLAHFTHTLAMRMIDIAETSPYPAFAA